MALVAPASANADVSWQLNISNAPPPPTVVVREQPHWILVPGSTVYTVNSDAYDYDYFRYGVFYYVSRGGYWYRARSYRGPFRVCEVRYVPRAILNVPVRYWRHPRRASGPVEARERRVVREGDGAGTETVTATDTGSTALADTTSRARPHDLRRASLRDRPFSFPRVRSTLDFSRSPQTTHGLGELVSWLARGRRGAAFKTHGDVKLGARILRFCRFTRGADARVRAACARVAVRRFGRHVRAGVP
jgi:hypothetical protein